MILASAAIPNLFRGVQVGDGTYWDGLFSQNPPVRELVDIRPDELWVIQINPARRAQEPRSVVEIADRRNELAGNLSLHQELGFIEKIDQLLEEGLLAEDGTYKQIVVRLIELARPQLSRKLGAASKLNRDPAFIAELLAHGEAMAEKFLAALAFEGAWRRGDPAAVLSCLPTTLNCLRGHRSLIGKGCAAASGSGASYASTSPLTSMSIRLASRWPAVGSAGAYGLGGTTPAGRSWGTLRLSSEPERS
jgi:hypothetical protein